MKRGLVVFTDLDGTLLDHCTYSFAAAEPALRFLRHKDIPLVLCSSKTRSEIEVVRAALGNTDPFIAENGGAAFIPSDYFPQEFSPSRKIPGYDIAEFGTPYARLLEVFKKIKELFPGKLSGFHELKAGEVAGLTGLSILESELAQKREYDEPFLLSELSVLEAVRETARQSGLNVVRGGRFFHLMGDNDKGRCAKFLLRLYAESLGHPVDSVGLGDSANDLPLLEAVDHPVLVRKPGGAYDSSVSLQGLYLAPGEGPAGWRAAILDLVPSLAG
jgi:mannosyl-3-phosphoglycerate phosphatase